MDEEHPPSTPPSSTHLPSTSIDNVSLEMRLPSTTRTDLSSQTTQPRVKEVGNALKPPHKNVTQQSKTAFPSRPIMSELLPSLSPERPRAPGRRAVRPDSRRTASKKVIQTSSDEDDDDPLSLSVIDRSYQAQAKHIPPAPTKARTRSKSHSRAVTPATSTGGSVPSLEAELKRVIRAEVEREIEQEMRELNRGAERILGGTGQRSTAGFLSGGGGGGTTVWIRDGLEREKAKKSL